MQPPLLAKRARPLLLLVQTVQHVLKTASLQFLSARYAPPTLLARPVTHDSLWLQGALPAAIPVPSQTVRPVSAAASAFTVQAAMSQAATRLPVNLTVALKTASCVLLPPPAGPVRHHIPPAMMQKAASSHAMPTLTSNPIPHAPPATVTSPTARPALTLPLVSLAISSTTSATQAHALSAALP